MDLDQIAAWLKEIVDEFVVIRDRLIAADDWLREALASSDANAIQAAQQEMDAATLASSEALERYQKVLELCRKDRENPSEEQGI